MSRRFVAMVAVVIGGGLHCAEEDGAGVTPGACLGSLAVFFDRWKVRKKTVRNKDITQMAEYFQRFIFQLALQKKTCFSSGGRTTHMPNKENLIIRYANRESYRRCSIN